MKKLPTPEQLRKASQQILKAGRGEARPTSKVTGSRRVRSL